jgi:hypothetical protein
MPRCSHKTHVGRVCRNKTCNGMKVCNVHANDCAICFDKCTRDEVCTLVCGHVYHKGCIDRWFENHHTCPTCRRPVRRPKIQLSINPETIDLDTMIHDIRNMIGALYDSGNFPSGPLYADVRNGTLVIIDLENGSIVSGA